MYFYKTTIKSVEVEWIAATVIEPREHYVECRRSQKERTMRVAYEHIRLIASNDLAKKITETYLEEEIASMGNEDLKTLTDLENNKEKDIYTEIFGDDSDSDDEVELQPIGSASTLLSKVTVGDTSKDVGQIRDTTTNNIDSVELQ